MFRLSTSNPKCVLDSLNENWIGLANIAILGSLDLPCRRARTRRPDRFHNVPLRIRHFQRTTWETVVKLGQTLVQVEFFNRLSRIRLVGCFVCSDHGDLGVA